MKTEHQDRKLTEPVPDKEKDELLRLVQDIADGKVFGTWCMTESDQRHIHLVFMPIALGCFPSGVPSNLGHIYEYLSEAGPRSLNGMPMFFSMAMINCSDWDFVAARVNKEIRRRNWVKSGGLLGWAKRGFRCKPQPQTRPTP